MAKGIDILGNLRGKRGGIVYYRAAGEQLSRPRVAPKNPKSAKQAVQRMVLATAAKLAGALSPIVDHSFEGIPVGTKSVNHFRSKALNVFRAAASTFDTESPATASFAIKGAPTIGIVGSLPISGGSLPFGGWADGNDPGLQHAFRANPTLNSQADYEAALALLGLVPGDQLTFVELDMSDDVVASMIYDGGQVDNKAIAVRYARVTFAPSLPAAAVGATFIDTTAQAFRSSLIVASEGVFPIVSIEGTVLNLASRVQSDYKAGAVIRSQKQANGRFKYSTSVLIVRDTFITNNTYPVYLSYMGGGVQIEVGDNLYLQNAVAQAMGGDSSEGGGGGGAEPEPEP